VGYTKFISSPSPVVSPRCSRVLAAAITAAVFLPLSPSAKGSTYSSAVLGFHPVDYYEFADASGTTGTALTGTTENTGSFSANSGTYNGSVTVGAAIPTASFPGMAGDNNSVSFNGSSSTNITANDASLSTGADARTLTEWVYIPSANTGPDASIFYGTHSSTEAAYMLTPYVTNSEMPNVGEAVYSGLAASVSGTIAINTSSWHFIALTETPETNNPTFGDYTFYIDGVQASGVAQIATNTVLGGLLKFSGDDQSGFTYTGQIAQVALFNSYLDSTQIGDLYTAAITPEPATLGLLLITSVPLVLRRRRAV
jgi:hypothetical protein